MTTRLPPWLRRRVNDTGESLRMKRLLRGFRLNTVCDEARCPNLRECFTCGTATFLLMGPSCTRSCPFCAIPVVEPGLPAPLDREEPQRVARAARRLGLRHVVVTSVTRDDLPDRGVEAFLAVVEALREELPEATTEVLTPDFGGREDLLDSVASSGAHVLNHNVETVRSLSPWLRPQGSYERSLGVLERFRAQGRGALVKSGIMVGLGETLEEIGETARDLARVGCQALTVGQYLRPRRENVPVKRFYHPEEFKEIHRIAVEAGLELVEASPLVRSSFRAHELLEERGGEKETGQHDRPDCPSHEGEQERSI